MKNSNELNLLSRKLMNIAVESALKVAPYLMEVFENGIIPEEKKGYHDLVTEADRNAEALLVEHLTQSYPDSFAIGEENGEQGTGSVSWIIDPIDGTNNFVSGIPFFCVSIGAVYDGEAIAGVIYDPVRQEMFSASLEGAFLNGESILSSGNDRDNTSLLMSGFPYEGGAARDEDFSFFQQLIANFHAVRRLGSTALELAYVASGRADVTFQTNANPWDVTAGMFLIKQAGGQYYVPKGTGDKEEMEWNSSRFVGACADFVIEESVLNDLLVSKERIA
jgi:myo-inositol-1(or 4)-monophosphatase